MSKEEFEKMLTKNQAALDQMLLGAEQNAHTLQQILGVATPGLITEFLQIVAFQINHNSNKRRWEQMQ